jgi:hypothetical protein
MLGARCLGFLAAQGSRCVAGWVYHLLSRHPVTRCQPGLWQFGHHPALPGALAAWGAVATRMDPRPAVPAASLTAVYGVRYLARIARPLCAHRLPLPRTTLPIASGSNPACCWRSAMPTSRARPRDHTRMLRMGVGVQPAEERQRITRFPNRLPGTCDHRRALSAASFLIVAALITPGSRLLCARWAEPHTGLLDVW